MTADKRFWCLDHYRQRAEVYFRPTAKAVGAREQDNNLRYYEILISFRVRARDETSALNKAKRRVASKYRNVLGHGELAVTIREVPDE